MPIEYTLLKSRLLAAPDCYLARVQQDTVDLEDITERILERSTTVGRVDIVAVVQAYNDAILRFIQEGKRVVTPLLRIQASIQGTFDSPADKFDPDRHQLVLAITPRKLLNRALEDVTLVKVRKSREPRPELYIDAVSGERNSTLTPGGVGRLLGVQLYFDQTDPRQGVFFRAADDSTVPAEMMVKVQPSELIFMVPALATGEYRLEVRSATNVEAAVSVGVLKPSLTVP